MNKIERYSNWCSVDRLDGINLRHGEILIIKWPDGQLQQIPIRVDVTTESVMEQGGPTQIEVRHASVLAYHRGVQVHVPLVGLEAQRVIP